MLRFGAAFLIFLLAAAAHATDHEPVLDARRQGNIAPFGEILSAARSAAGGRTVLLDAKFIDSRTDALMKVYLRRPSNGQVLVVTVDAVRLEVVRLVARGAPVAGHGVDDPALANSRPIDPARSAAGSGATAGAGGKDPGSGGKDPDAGGKDPDGGGKDGGGGGKGGNDGGKDGGGRGGRDAGTGDGKGGDGGHGGGKGGSGK